MIKPGLGGFLIFKKDIENKTVQIKHYKGMQEFWVYRTKKTKSDIYLANGKKFEHEGNVELFCIITCKENDSNMIEQDKGYLVHGIKFTNQETPDLDNYLSKTNRHQ